MTSADFERMCFGDWVPPRTITLPDAAASRWWPIGTKIAYYPDTGELTVTPPKPETYEVTLTQPAYSRIGDYVSPWFEPGQKVALVDKVTHETRSVSEVVSYDLARDVLTLRRQAASAAAAAAASSRAAHLLAALRASASARADHAALLLARAAQAPADPSSARP